ncbi:MAG: DUF1854 domain-containing protein [Candidatus Hydrogenedentes bacterium]|nr:DUF1854 domain-containing protein [Candidatus Hydrogenedentota bacterium]
MATDTDLDIVGEYSERWVILTKKQVLVFMLDENEAVVMREEPIEGIKTARTDSRVGSGFLEIKTGDDVYEELLRFSNKNSEKFAKVAAKIKSVAQGKEVKVDAEEDQIITGRCQKCGARLPEKRMTICPKCLNRGMVFMRFLARTKEYWPYTVTAMVLVVTTILFSLLPPQLTRILIDNVLGDKDNLPHWFRVLTGMFGITSTRYREEWLYLVVGSLATSVVILSVIGWLRERLAVSIANRLAYDLRRDVFEKLEDIEVRYYDIHPVGQLMTRASHDIEALQGFINQLTSGFGYQILLVVAVGVAMYSTDWKLALIATFPAPIVMLCTIFFSKRIVHRWHKFWTTRSNLSNVLHAALSGIRVVKAFAQEVREAERVNSYSAKYRDSGLDVGYAAAFFYPAMGFVFQLGSYFVWLYGGHQILAHVGGRQEETLTPGVLIMFLGYLAMFYGPLNSLTQMSNWFTQFTTQAHRVFEILDHDIEIKEAPDSIDLEIQGTISFNEVTFGYDPHVPVLHEVGFTVNQGQMVGVVGHSGSGKSTAVNLITRFYDPNKGVVTIDNIDIRKIKRKCLRRQIGLVLQDPFLFRGTIADNIAYGNPDVAPELILNAALSANAHMFITRNHDGYDLRLGESGSGLSGGERQRVAIARALLHNPRILILDEATSSVDTIAEREIQKALEALSLGRTVIAIAHRLSTLRNCDRIIVFEEGHIREQGTHEELLTMNGIYKKLVEIQTQLTSDNHNVDGLTALNELQQADEIKKAAETRNRAAERTRGEVPKIRYLDPKNLHIYSMDEGGMHVMYKDEVHEHVRAYRCFPISRPSEFVALWTGTSALEHREVGMIRRSKELAPSSRLAVEHELAKRYFIHYIQKINEIREDIGFLTWDVETDKGHMEFLTKRWERSSVREGGRSDMNGRIIFDIDDNRYEIEDLDALDEDSRDAFAEHIFW